tara:strand:- start:787 stop:1017 length:231 start_codon:yes stop_codon:yes gene_type:complete
MKKNQKKEYVSISARIPKEIYIKMSSIRDSLDMTTNQIVSHCIDDWVDLAVCPQKTTTHRLSVARYALKITEDEGK